MCLVTVLTVVTALSRGKSLAEREQQTQPQNSLIAVFHVVESTWPNLYLKRACEGWYGCKAPFLQSYVFLWVQEKHLNPALLWSAATVSPCLQPPQAAPDALQPGTAVSWSIAWLGRVRGWEGAGRALLWWWPHQVLLQIQNLKCKCLLDVSYQPKTL